MNVPLPISIATCIEIQSVIVYRVTLQPRNHISNSLPQTVLGNTFTFDAKDHCFKICVELSFLFDSEILSNNLSSRKGVFLGRPDRPLSTIEFVSENLFKVLMTVERSHGPLAAIWRIE